MGTRTESVRVTADVSNFTTKMAAAGAAAKGFAGQLDEADRSGTLLRDSIVGLAPALVPLAAAAVPAVAGLSVSLVAAGAAAATAGLAFSGVGGSLTALNAYQLNPTTANLQTLQAKMALMAPAARDFVTFLDGLTAPLDKLRQAAAQGFLPGLQAGITDAMTQLPTVTRLVGSVADEMGRLSKAGGRALTGPFWTQFLDFLARTTGPALDTLGRTLGNVAEGVAALFQAFSPMGTSFNNGLLNMSRGFADWSKSLSQTQGFTDFTNYIRETGPQVLSTLGSLANALIQIGTAAAPIGQVIVPAIGALADVLAAIAASPVGPVLVGAAVGLSALNRAMAAYSTAKASSLVTTLAGPGDAANVGVGFAKAAVGAVGFGVALDGLVQPANSARGALELVGGGAAIGAMFGPEGALIGGAVGGLTALGKALLSTGDAAGTSVPPITSYVDTLNQVTGATTSMTRGLAATNLESFQVTLDGVSQSALQLGKSAGISGGSLVDAIVGSPQDLQATQDRIDGIIKGLQSSLSPVGGSGEAVAVDPALVKSTNDKINALQTLSKYLADNRAQLLSDEQAFQRVSAAAAGGSGKIADFGNQMLTTADSASQLATVLDTLFGPKLNLSAATDAFTSSLKGLDAALAKGSGALKGNSSAALQNRGAIRSAATSLEGMLKAQADAGASTRKLAASLADGRSRLLAAGQAAGIAKKDMNDYLDTLGLTPKLVSTLIKAYGVDQANAAAKGLQRAYNALPKDVRTDIAANGVSANATVDSLMAKYRGLSRADATTILKAVDQASGPINSVRLSLSQLNGYTATTYIRTVTTGGSPASGVQVQGADGMVVDYYGAGGMRENHIAQIAPAGSWRVWAEPETGGEAYIPFAPAKRERSRDIADETVRRLGGDVQWFAKGGMTKKQQEQAVAQALRVFSIDGTKQSAGDIRGQLRSLEKALRDTFGRDAKWLNRIDSLGDRISARAAREDKLQNALGKMTTELQSTRQASRQYSQTVAGSINNDIFGNGLAGLQTQLRADRNDNASMLTALRRGRSRGLSGPLLKALAASGDLGTAQQIGRMSGKEVERLERLYGARNAAQRQLGGFAAQQVYGRDVRQQTQDVRRMSDRVDRMSRTIEGLENKIERGVNDGARQGVAAGISQRDHSNNTKRRASR